VSPRAPDPRVRTALIEAAARLLIEHGPDALTTRRLAAEVGTSTMAVYTHFRGMDELRAAVAEEGFRRLAAYLDAARRTRDPVADVAALGGAYFLNALTNPHLYQFMFVEQPPQEDPAAGHETFQRLVDAVERVVKAGRFSPADPMTLAGQLWAMSHGIVTLHLAGLFTLQEALDFLSEMGTNLFVAFGDERSSARRSVEKARARIQKGELGTLPPAGIQGVAGAN
jgi:AcrR family transcriptional regulator